MEAATTWISGLGHELVRLEPEVAAGLIVAALLAMLAYLRGKAKRVRMHTRRVLLYVSQGGTCRDPMAKAITEQLFASRRLKHPIDIYAVGVMPVDTTASYGARKVIEEMYSVDLLRNHKPATAPKELIERADLILVMDKKLFDATDVTLPRSKTHILKEFFGLKGDIADPYRATGERDPETMKRYRDCANELREILSNHLDDLLRALDAV